MNANDLDQLLKQFCDNPEEYERAGEVVQFIRRGRERVARLSRQAGVGVCIQDEDDEEVLLPVPVYIQRRLLDLPGLAKQIVRSLRDNPEISSHFIHGPAQLDGADVNATESLRGALMNPPIDATKIVLIMARAGQGKTVLLQNLALKQATDYTPESSPIPLLLNVDLVGRYVGTVVDAIAGTLNKSLMFPMTHRDVMACIRMGWMGITLDGFDELTARIGPRDAFLRITELVTELQGQGVVFLSARDAFFEQYRIVHAIRSYLNPRSGNYDSSILKLGDWTEIQALELFTRLSVPSAREALSHIFGRFPGASDIVLQPFFLSRLAKLWLQGESFGDLSSGADEHTRVKFAIDAMLQREAVEKWRTREGDALLTLDEHQMFLAALAGEMWCSTAFQLDAEEIAIVCEIAGQEAGLDQARTEDVKARFPSHAMMATVGAHSGFAHEKFFRYFLGLHIARAIAAGNQGQLESALRAQELSGETADWVAFFGVASNDTPADCTARICDVAEQGRDDSTLRSNAGLLASRVCTASDQSDIHHVIFSGNMLTGRDLKQVGFRSCLFMQADLRGTVMTKARFDDCTFQNVVMDHTTRIDADIVDSELASVQMADSVTFHPEAVRQVFMDRGARVSETSRAPTAVRDVAEDQLQLATQISRLADRRAEFTIDEAIERLGRPAKAMIQHGIACQVISQPRLRASKGNQRQFVRFLVDRNEFLRGSTQRVASRPIERFWSEL